MSNIEWNKGCKTALSGADKCYAFHKQTHQENIREGEFYFPEYLISHFLFPKLVYTQLKNWNQLGK